MVASVVHDTYKRVRDGRVLETVPRESLVDAHGPWIFERALLERAIARVRAGDQPCRRPVDLVRLAGLEVRLLEWSLPA